MAQRIKALVAVALVTPLAVVQAMRMRQRWSQAIEAALEVDGANTLK